MVSGDPIPANLSWPGLELIERVSDGTLFDPGEACVIVLDCEPHRTGAIAPGVKKAGCLINIDHHGTNLGSGKAFCVNPEAAATGELIYELLKNRWQTALTEEIATNLFAALSGDTGTFRYSNTTGQTLQIAGELVQHGANPAKIAMHLYENRAYETVNLMRRALDTLEISEDGLVSWITVTRAMSGEDRWIGQHSEDLVQFPRMIKTVKLAILFREIEPEKTKASFRSRSGIDASYIASLFGGGGHAQAAGCTIHSPLAEARAQVLDAVVRELHRAQQARIAGGNGAESR